MSVSWFVSQLGQGCIVLCRLSAAAIISGRLPSTQDEEDLLFQIVSSRTVIMKSAQSAPFCFGHLDQTITAEAKTAAQEGILKQI